MAYKIRSDVETMTQVTVQGKSTGLSVTDHENKTYQTDINGECTFPVLTTDDVNYIINELPLSQYGEIYENTSLAIQSSGYNLTFTRPIPALLGGLLYTFPATTVVAPTVASGTQTQYVYATLVLGEPQYKISATQLTETYIDMFIGTLTVGTAGISAININKVSRFSTYRPSVTQKGSAIPVSTGNPAQAGTIGW